MYNFRFNVSNIAEKLLEPVFRVDKILSSIKAWFSGIQYVQDIFYDETIPTQTYLSNINSCKISFEYFLNNDFNIDNYTFPIYIQNSLQEDTFFYGFNEEENERINALYFIQNNLSGVITTYSKYLSYPGYTLVKQAGQIYETFLSTGAAPDQILNPLIFQPATYGFNNNEMINFPDFVVYVPTSLNVADFDTRIKAYIKLYKMVHVEFAVEYY
jgi:hypothetical protein